MDDRVVGFAIGVMFCIVANSIADIVRGLTRRAADGYYCHCVGVNVWRVRNGICQHCGKPRH